MAEKESNSGDPGLEKLLQRVESLKESQKVIAEDIKEVKSEAKKMGYDVKAFGAVLSLRAKDKDTREMIGLYADRLGVFG